MTSQNRQHERSPAGGGGLINVDHLHLNLVAIDNRERDSLAELVCDVDEISLLSVIDHHAQTVRVTVGSWWEEAQGKAKDCFGLKVTCATFGHLQEETAAPSGNISDCSTSVPARLLYPPSPQPTSELL